MNCKEKITEAFLQLVLENRSTGFSVTDICARAGISRPTFYRYFKDKYAIIEEILYQDCISALPPLMENHLSPTLIMEDWYLRFYRNKDFYSIAIRESGQNSLFDTIISSVYRFNVELFSRIFEMSPEEVDYVAYKHAAAQAMLLKKWMEDGMKVSPSKMTRYYFHDLTSPQKCKIFFPNPPAL